MQFVRLKVPLFGDNNRESSVMDGETSTSWPLTTDGVTDWESVFEDLKTGFIVLIRSAHSVATLKACATVVVQQLFTREDDGMNVMKYILNLESILQTSGDKDVTADELNVMRDAVSNLLRAIKEDRILMSQEYLEKRINSEERRSS